LDFKGFTPLDIIKTKQQRAGHGMAQRQSSDLDACVEILCKRGASKRIRSHIPVEADTDMIVFDRSQQQRYYVKSAVLSTLVTRLCQVEFYNDEDAKALALSYRVVTTDLGLLNLIFAELKTYVSKESDDSDSIAVKFGATEEKTPSLLRIRSANVSKNYAEEDLEPKCLRARSANVSTIDEDDEEEYDTDASESAVDGVDSRTNLGGIISLVSLWSDTCIHTIGG
jgi:hypothetical protein